MIIVNDQTIVDQDIRFWPDPRSGSNNWFSLIAIVTTVTVTTVTIKLSRTLGEGQIMDKTSIPVIRWPTTIFIFSSLLHSLQ